MDFSNIDSTIYGNDESDEELLAELLSLEKEEKRNAAVKQPSKPPSAGSFTAKKPNVASHLDENFDDDLDDEDLENDEDLQNELFKLVEYEKSSVPPVPSAPVVRPPIPPAPSRHAPLPPPPIPPPRDISLDKEDKEMNLKLGDGGASTSVSRKSDVSLANNVAQVKPTGPTTKQSPSSLVPLETGSTSDSTSERIIKILTKRRDAFMANTLAAKNADDKESAVEYLDMVKMFNEALKASQSADLTEVDLNDIPKTPPPYKKKTQPTTLLEDLEARMLKYQELVDKYKQSGEEQRARMNSRIINTYKEAISAYKKGRPIDVVSLPVPPGFQPLTQEDSYPSTNERPKSLVQNAADQRDLVQKPGPSSKATAAAPTSEQQSQLKFLLTRQIQYKQAAIEAKKQGDLETAKTMLMNSKKLDMMIEASRSGLPVKISDIPVAPQANVPSGFVQATINRVTPNNASIVEKELIKQLQLCDQLRKQFTQISDAKSVLLIETLLNETKKDLLYFRQCLKSGQMPKYAITEQSLPSLEKHSEIPEDMLQLKILSVNNIKLPDGWKPKDCSLYVTYDFPFPSEKHQTGKTQTISGTDNPEFPDTFQMSIIRKTVRFINTIKKRSIKFEIYQKGSFLRNDKLWGTAELQLVELEKFSSIVKTVSILEGRRKTGGTISIEICASHPIGGDGKQTVTKKWVKIHH